MLPLQVAWATSVGQGGILIEGGPTGKLRVNRSPPLETSSSSSSCPDKDVALFQYVKIS